MPFFTDIAIAPGGDYIAARVNIDNKYGVRVIDVSKPNIQLITGFSESDEMFVDWFRWISKQRLLVSLGFTAKRGNLRPLRTRERRLVVFDTSEKSMISLFRVRRNETPVQIQDRVVSFLPEDPDHILVQYRKQNSSKPGVYKVNVTKSGRHSRVLRGRSGVLRWMADSGANVRLGSGINDIDEPYLIARVSTDSKWIDLSDRVRDSELNFDPVAFTADAEMLYVLSNHEGDPSGLYTFDIEADAFGELIFKHPSVDIRSVDIDDVTGELRSITFIEDDVATEYFSRRPIDDDIDKLASQFSGKSIFSDSISEDGQYAVLRLRSPSTPSVLALFNRPNGSLKMLPPQYPELADATHGETIVTSYSARDGLEIPAYITLPPGITKLEQVDRLPFIIHPHGGPASRDFLRFSFDVQFLASRGYGVLQMNFRGSAGYGQAFKQAGAREWGQAMQDDITDGANWLTDKGLADPERIAIVGGSYGGYAALMGAVKTPDLYQCALSFAGVSDLPDFLKHRRRFLAGEYSTRFIGDLWKDREMLAENSPARRAAEIKVPILLMHGDDDNVVPIQQSKKMAKELRKHSKNHDYIVFEGGDHHLSLYPHRLQYLQEMERFLGECLVPEPAAETSQTGVDALKH